MDKGREESAILLVIEVKLVDTQSPGHLYRKMGRRRQ